MTRFVIDEVVLQNAYVGKDSRGNIDRISTKFILHFCDSPHKLALNSTIKGKYHKLSDKMAGQKILLNVPSLLHQLLLASNRLEYFENGTIDFEGPKKCDKEFVKVTKESQGILVTEDGPLINVIQQNGLSDLVKVKKISDALPLLTAS